jgi:hypothetical protein
MGLSAEGSEFESLYGQEFLLIDVVQSRSGTYPASWPVGTRGGLS